MLTGLAGAGKTRLLDRLAQLGEQVIDLERLANHSGSVFGGLGKPPQPSHELFQQLVTGAWSSAKPDAPLWIEDEGPFIGSVGLPPWLQETFTHLPVVEVVADRAERIARIVEEYGSTPAAELEAALNRLDRRFDRSRCNVAAKAIRTGQLRYAIEIILDYYDAAYRHRMSQQRRKILATYISHTDDPHELIRVVRSSLLNQ